MGSVISSWSAASSPTASLLLDVSGLSGAAAAYSMARKLRAAYAGSAFRMRRDSDNAEQDIGFSGNDVDEAAIATFMSGATNGYCVTWYDQSGNGLNLTQSTQADQPYAHDGGFLHGKRSLLADGSSDYMRMSAASASLAFTECTVAIVMDSPSAGNRLIIGEDVAGEPDVTSFEIACTVGSNSVLADYPGGGPGYAFLPHDNPPTGSFLHIGSVGDVSDDFHNRMNGVESGSAIGGQAPQALPANNRLIQVAKFLSGFCSARFQELVVWGSVLSTSSMQSAESNVNNYYTIY